VRAAAARSRRPRTILGLLNEALIRQGSERFCTVVYARFRIGPGGTRVTVGSGGHWLPLLATPDGTVTPIGRHGTLLGVVAEPKLEDATVEMHPGDTVVFFTDGVVEARRNGDLFESTRLDELVGGLVGMPARHMAAAILDAVVAFQDGLPVDDIAIVVVRVPQPE
jgi:sigma-B regulation protein RsbU (phosphoserine phosphatase)